MILYVLCFTTAHSLRISLLLFYILCRSVVALLLSKQTGRVYWFRFYWRLSGCDVHRVIAQDDVLIGTVQCTMVSWFNLGAGCIVVVPLKFLISHFVNGC
jgi:hypothetical protein